MKKELLEVRKYIWLVLIGVLSYWLLNHFYIFFNIISTIFKVLSPFILGGVIAFILNIPMSKIESLLKEKTNIKDGLSRGISIVLALLIFVAILAFVAFLLVPELIGNIKNLINTIPNLVSSGQQVIINLLDQSPDIQSQIIDMFEQSGNVTDIVSNVLNYIVNGAVGFIKSFISSFITIFTSIIFSIYMLSQKEELINGTKRIIKALTGKANSKKIFEIAKLTQTTFSRFLSGQCLDVSILGVLMFVVLALFRFPYPLLISVLTAITALIPVFGAWIAMIIGTILILITNPFQALMFIIVFTIIQQIENNFIYPKVVGASVGLSPMWSLLAITVGGKLFGVIGMLVGLPIASVVYSLLKNTVNQKLKDREEKIEN